MKQSVNLLPWTCRKAQLIRLRLVQWSVVWAVVSGLTAAACVVRWGQWREGRDQAERLEQAYLPTSALLAEIKTLGGEVAQLRAQEAAITQLEPSRPALTLLGLVSRSARQCEGRLRVEQLTLAGPQQASGGGARAAADASPETSARHVSIKGIALDDLAVTQFVLALRQTKAFDRVELKSSQEQGPSSAARLRSYAIECGY